MNLIYMFYRTDIADTARWLMIAFVVPALIVTMGILFIGASAMLILGLVFALQTEFARRKSQDYNFGFRVAIAIQMLLVIGSFLMGLSDAYQTDNWTLIKYGLLFR